jgi:hypothetical protein
MLCTDCIIRYEPDHIFSRNAKQRNSHCLCTITELSESKYTSEVFHIIDNATSADNIRSGHQFHRRNIISSVRSKSAEFFETSYPSGAFVINSEKSISAFG